MVFVAYALTSELYPSSNYAFWAAGALLLPWLALRSLTFNARNSAFRGLRFDFTAKPAEAARVYLGMLLVVALTAGIAFPWFMARQKAFVVSRHGFGTGAFHCELPARLFYGFYIVGLLILLAVLVPAAALMFYPISRQVMPEGYEWAAFLVGSLGFYGGWALSHAYVQARSANLLWNNVAAPGVRFARTLSAAKLARLYIGNIVAIVCSAGPLIPWAVIRTLRYRLANFAMLVTAAPVFEANPALPQVGAAGQELGEIFNLDLGI